ncbi:MAG: helix-turn-helix domain-containing protein [Parvibaculaceae bacterium]
MTASRPDRDIEGRLSVEPVPRAPYDLKNKTPKTARIRTFAAYDRRDQFDVCRVRVRDFWDVELPPGRDPASGFTGESLSANLGGPIFFSEHADPYMLRRAPHAAGGSPIDHWLLLLGRSGKARLEFGDSQVHAKAGSLFLIALGQDHRGVMNHFEHVGVVLPRDSIADASALDRASGTILSGPLARLLADYLTLLERQIADFDERELVQAGRATIGMALACLQPTDAMPDEARAGMDQVLFERARTYIESRLSDPELSPDLLAQKLRVSRSSLYRAFRHVDGIARHIQRARLAAARAALQSESHTRIEEVAYAHGFRLASDFARAFRREFGCSPREAREEGGGRP